MPFCIFLIASILGPFKKDLFMPLFNKKKAGRKKKQKVINLVNGSGIPTGARQQSKQQKRR